MSFHEVRLPEDISPGVQWGSSWSTVVVVTGAGFEQRLQQWSRPRRVGRISLDLRTADQAEALVAFFDGRAGRAFGFRYKDWSDYTATDEPLDHNEAATVQLTKTYTSGGIDRIRNIYKPVAGTVTLEVNSSPYTSFLLDENSGTIYLAGALGSGDVLTWSGEFDVPVRFDTDLQELVQQAPDWRDWSGIPIVEVREAPTPVAPTLDPLVADGSAEAGNLELYLRSDQVTGSDGATVDTWPDISGNARDAAAAGTARPLLRLTGADIAPNGVRMLEFDGTDDGMAGAFPGGGIANTNGYTLYVYGKELSLTTGGFNTQLLFSSSSLELMSRTSVAAGYPTEQDYGMRGTGSNRVSFGDTTLGYQTVTAIWYPPAGASGEMKCFLNGVQSGSTGTDWDATMATQYLVGNNTGGVTGFRGTKGAVLVFNKAHDEVTRMKIEGFLRSFFED